MTLAELIAGLKAAPGVKDAWTEGEPRPVGPGSNFHVSRVMYVMPTSANAAKSQAHSAMIYKYGQAGLEEAYWDSRLPEPLVVAEPVVFIADRTVSTITEAMIISFAHGAWRHALGGNQAGAPNIKNISVRPQDGSSVRVQGLFYLVGPKEWVPGDYIIRMLDPDGSVDIASGNIVFEKVAA